MAKQFWNEENTKGSLDVLKSIVGKADFVLIGGWAVNYYTNKQKSLDVDIAIDYGALEYFKQFGVSQYGNLNIKYSVINSVYVDLFINGFTDNELPFPVSEILKNYIMIENIKVVEKELLLLLKLWGYFRADRQKHSKDIVDVLSLLLYADIDMSKLKRYIKTYKISARRSTDAILEYLDVGDTLLDYLEIGKDAYLEEKKKLKDQIRNRNA